MIKKTTKKFQNIAGHLKNNLKKSASSVSGRKISCCLIDSKNDLFFGYNIETKAKNIHAEQMALSSLKQKNKIQEIHLTANGSYSDIKNAIPCINCCNALTPHVNKNTKIFLHFNDFYKHYEFDFHEIKSSYLRNKKQKIKNFISHSPLSIIDKKMLSIFKDEMTSYNKLHPEFKSLLYITGTSSGRGGPKMLVAKKITNSSYWDIDLIIVFDKKTPRNSNSLIKRFYSNALTKSGFPHKNIKEKLARPYRFGEKKGWEKKFLYRKIYFTEKMPLEINKLNLKKDLSQPSILDVSVGTDLKSTITEQYYKKNQYIQII